MCATSNWSASESTGALNAIASVTRPDAKHACRHPGTARRSCDSVWTRARYGSQHSSTTTDGTIPLIGPAPANGSEINATTTSMVAHDRQNG